ncbi:MAG: protein-glutamate O-methyltransferase CheR [Deltaproteobacteria bacterium]|nr:protein-glutamate O-methyltransferase CheR [Deltaproteobacteria bacterium]
MNNILAANTQMETLEIGDDELAEIGLILEMRCNFTMSNYKDKCMKRRVAIRMRSCRCNDAASYCNLLLRSEHELNLLQKALTIHVSQFFRNPSVFEKLRSDVIPSLYKSSAEQHDQLRICSLGCAGGEEAYSIAILLREYFANDFERVDTFITGMDIDLETIRIAERGEYNPDRLKELSDAYKEKYFTASGSRMQLSSTIREMVTFNQGDITVVENYRPHDLVLCRNTLIYFTRIEQEKILNGIADILQPGGILVLGKSETLVGDVRRKFTAVCPVERIYRRI